MLCFQYKLCLGILEVVFRVTVPVVHCAARTESCNRDVSTSRWDSQCAQRNELQALCFQYYLRYPNE